MGALQTPVRISLKNILVATDFSFCSEMALHFAAIIARRHGARLFLAHVLPAEARPAIPIEPLPPELDTEHRRAESQIIELLRDPVLSGITCDTLLAHGAFWEVLGEMMVEKGIDLLVTGTHGREGLKKVVLGSVAEQIFRFASRPVLTVGPHVDPKLLADSKLQHVLFATDFSDGSLHALPYALALAQEDGAALTLLHVVTATIPTELAVLYQGEYQDRLVVAAREQLQKISPAEAELGRKPELLVACGTPADCILRKAAERNSSMIVMGVHHGAPRAASHVPWTIAHRVVGHAHCPVLTVRGG